MIDIQLEWVPEDLWIGVYWKKTQPHKLVRRFRYDIYICLLPCLPIHVTVLR